MKRGIVDAQFNWIFILIAGFVIFMFIISVVISQKRNSDIQSNIAVIKQINTLIKGKQQTVNTFSEIKIPETTMTFSCDPDTEIFDFKIEGSDRIQLPIEIIFADDSLKGNKLQVWTQSFDMPFPVTTFSYITTSSRAIIFYNNSETADMASEIYNALPGNFTKIYASPSDVADKVVDFKNYRIVCFEGVCPDSQDHFDYVRITPANQQYGNVTFASKGIEGREKPYITSAAMYGALFSAGPAAYECQMSRAMKIFSIKRDIVANRLGRMTNSISGGCNASITFIKDYPLKAMDNSGYNQGNISIMYENAFGPRGLGPRNNDLALGSCPRIY